MQNILKLVHNFNKTNKLILKKLKLKIKNILNILINLLKQLLTNK